MQPPPSSAALFRSLHAGAGVLVTPNPWDAGSARLLADLGFKALATSSAAAAYALGRPDGALTRDETIAHARLIAEATALPVSADLENGFGPAPEDAAQTIRQAIGAGLAGGSIEDASSDPVRPIYAFDHAVERVAAAVEAARSSGSPFVLTARAENFLHGRPDLDDTIARLRAFEAAGADVLYAPGLPDLAAVRRVCASMSRPVNVLAAAGAPFTVAALREAGVRRISLGSSLVRVALGAFLKAAHEVIDEGTFERAARGLPYAQANALMAKPQR